MKIEELKSKTEEQRKRNIELYKSIPLASHEDPTNEKAQPILEEWRKGSERIKLMMKKLQELELTKSEPNNNEEDKSHFVNGFGEATKRYITCAGYERAEKRNKQTILSFMGSR